ncbi:MAG: CpsD/CapB family tyrosine-protein kinase, partial [Planctomycetota bacterium]
SVSSIVAILVNRAKFCDFNTIMVSSAMPGEGKSTLSHSLWRGLSEANYKVVLVDFDLRHPALHHDLGVEIGAGLSDILAEEASIDDCLKQHTSTRSYVTAGSAYRINLAAAAQDMLPQLFNELRSRFDFVIVDTAPLLPVVDTRIIGEYVDGCVLSVMRDQSRIPQVVAAVETLKAHGTPLLGVVVSGCKSAARDVGYYYSENR